MFGLLMKDFSNPTPQRWAVEYLSPASSLWQAARLVFAPSFVDAMRDGLHATVSREMARYDDSLEGHALFFMSNRARRRAMPNPIKIFGRHAWPFLPGLTQRCVDVLWRIPIREKVDERLYRRVLERHFPELARIPYCSHGHLLPGTGRGLGYRVLAARSAFVQHPRVGDWLRRVGVVPDDASEPTPVATALTRVDLDSPFLDADGVRRLKAMGATRDPAGSMGRELVFYWDSRQRIMSGRPLEDNRTIDVATRRLCPSK